MTWHCTALEDLSAADARLAEMTALRLEFSKRQGGQICEKCESKHYPWLDFDHALTGEENHERFEELRRALINDGWEEAHHNAGFVRRCQPCKDARPFKWMLDIEINAFADYIDAHPGAMLLDSMRSLLRYRHDYLRKGSGYVMPDGVTVVSTQDRPDWPELPDGFSLPSELDLAMNAAKTFSGLARVRPDSGAVITDISPDKPKGGFEFL